MSGVENLSTEQIIKETSGTVNELKKFVKESELTEKQIQKLLNAEKENKDRKTARKFLERKKGQVEKNRELSEAEKEIRDVEEKIQSVEEKQVEREKYDLKAPDIIKILSDSEKNIREKIVEKKFAEENLEEILESEKNFKNRESVKKNLKSEIRKIHEAEKFAQAEEDVRELEEKISEINSGEEMEKSEKSETEEKESEKDNSGTEESGDEDSEPGEQEDAEDSSEEKEEEKTDESGEEDLEDLIEEKPGEVLDKVDKMSVDDIEKLTFEEKLLEELIEDLEGDFDPEKLKEVSTRDLIKLRAELDEKNSEEQEEDEEKEENDKDKEAMEEEAEEDLQMLMGAGLSEEEVDESESKLSQIENFKQGLKQKLNREKDEEEETTTGIDEEQVLDVLEDYKDLPEREAAIKTAHIMKGYLEYRKGVERELTYSELADKLEESDESEKELSEYFEKMSKDEYTGNVNIDSGKIIETSREVVKKLS